MRQTEIMKNNYEKRGCFFACALSTLQLSAEEIEVDLLVVGGTESGCAAAVQAARMGIKKIALVKRH